MHYYLETINEDTIVTSSTGRKYIIVEATTLGGWRKTTYDMGVIFEWKEYDSEESPGDMWFGEYVNYFMGANTYSNNEEELLASVRSYIEEYERNNSTRRV